MLAVIDDFKIDKITGIISKIYESVGIPEDLIRSIFIELPLANRCELRRIIILMNSLSEHIMGNLTDRTDRICRPKIGVVFKYNATTIATFMVLIITESTIKMYKDVQIFFIYHAK